MADHEKMEMERQAPRRHLLLRVLAALAVILALLALLQLAANLMVDSQNATMKKIDENLKVIRPHISTKTLTEVIS